jgi:hypothetical protein
MIAVVFLIAGCATTQGLKMEPSSVAKQLGLPDCKVSVPLSQSEALADARKNGNSDPERYPEWKVIVENQHPEDQLRLVDCLKASRSKDIAPYYYALIRNGAIIYRFHGVVFD